MKTLQKWDVEDPAFWDGEGKKIPQSSPLLAKPPPWLLGVSCHSGCATRVLISERSAGAGVVHATNTTTTTTSADTDTETH